MAPGNFIRAAREDETLGRCPKPRKGTQSP
jgi:hypothetical protein